MQVLYFMMTSCAEFCFELGHRNYMHYYPIRYLLFLWGHTFGGFVVKNCTKGKERYGP